MISLKRNKRFSIKIDGPLMASCKYISWLSKNALFITVYKKNDTCFLLKISWNSWCLKSHETLNLMKWTDEKLSIIYSDGNKFNLNGSVSWAYYWHDICKETRRFFFIKQHWKGFLLMWGTVFCNGIAEITLLRIREYFEVNQ